MSAPPADGVQPQEPDPSSTKVTLMCSWICPYAQRAWIAINAKQIPFQYVEIDLANKPSWLPKYSPLGKVPAVVYNKDGKTVNLYESMVLTEWAEDYAGSGPSLLPADATERARARLIMARYDSRAVSNFYKLLMSKSKEEAHAAAAALKDELQWLEHQMDAEGPFIMGSQLSLVDCIVLPQLLRACVLKRYRGYNLLEGLPKLKAYLEVASAAPAVRASIKPPPGKSFEEGLVEAYTKYGGEPVDYFGSSSD